MYYNNSDVHFVGHKGSSQHGNGTLPSGMHFQQTQRSQSSTQSLRRKNESGNIVYVQDSLPKRCDSSSILESDIGSSKSGCRRPSVDTVSTYLSHESELRASTSHVSNNI